MGIERHAEKAREKIQLQKAAQQKVQVTAIRISLDVYCKIHQGHPPHCC